jgi:signal transduction histidine kinase
VSRECWSSSLPHDGAATIEADALPGRAAVPRPDLIAAALTRGGLRGALSALASRAPVPVDIDVAADRLPQTVEATAYFVVAEALTNAAKHANASRVRVTAEALEGALRVCVRDDGVGGADQADGSGLVGLKDRVEALGGTMTVDSPPGSGTTLVARLPLGDTAGTASERAGL